MSKFCYKTQCSYRRLGTDEIAGVICIVLFGTLARTHSRDPEEVTTMYYFIGSIFNRTN